MDYTETFTLVAKINATMILLSLAANLNLYIRWTLKMLFVMESLMRKYIWI